VPAFILNNQFLVEGAQPVEHLIAAIRQAAERAANEASEPT
jgi:predicted DsbA family dithiol-disulfide isomerase